MKTLEDIYKGMLKLNPLKKVSHPKCDWVIENFMDEALENGHSSQEVLGYWNKQNTNK